MQFFREIEHKLKMRRKFKILRGVKLDVSQPAIDHHVKELVVRGLYEAEEYQLLARFLSPHDKVLELGACIGFISSFAAKTCGSNNVVCVEANPKLISVIKTNHTLNNVSPTIITGVASIEDSDECDFYIGERVYGSSTLQREGSRKIQQHSVDVNRLIREFQSTSLVVDIEGGEIDLLPQLVMGDINLIIVEFHPFLSSFETVTDCIKSLIDKGFSLRVDQCQNSCVVLQRQIGSKPEKPNRLVNEQHGPSDHSH